jgi:RNA polymerase sigma factor (TIGR02999 family)
VGREHPGQTLQGTALVHEAFVRLMHGSDGDGRRWTDQWHLYAAAAETMRRVLVDAARRRGRLKRGGGRHRVDLDHVSLEVERSGEELLAIDEALTQFAAAHPEKARLVQLRYFAGLTSEQAAAAMNISNSTADRYWTFAKAWLYRRVAAGDTSSDAPSH